MPNFYMPLSGPVNQAFQYWTNMTMGQVGLININMGKSSDPVLEQQILDDVGTYGRQLGQIGDALAVLLKHVKLEDLEPDEVSALDAFKLQLAQIERLKARR